MSNPSTCFKISHTISPFTRNTTRSTIGGGGRDENSNKHWFNGLIIAKSVK